MKLAVIAFSRSGKDLCRTICKKFNQPPDTCEGTIMARYEEKTDEESGMVCLREPAAEWTGRMFAAKDGLIFIGACGIAVRLIAPWLQDKYRDPAVVVVDDAGRHVISLLSGHIGRANELTRRIADILGAEPVITTGSDVRGICAVDEWAAGLGLVITDRKLAGETAAAILDGDRVGFFEDSLCQGYCRHAARHAGYRDRPDGCGDYPGGERVIGVSPQRSIPASGAVLHLIPRCLIVGVGCKRGVHEEIIQAVIDEVLEAHYLDPRAVSCLASIDRKSEEKGLLAVAKKWNLPFVAFSSDVLRQIPGNFSESEFVREITGVGNVCERAACAAGTLEEYCAGVLRKLPEGWEKRTVRLLAPKYADRGVTVAVAVPVYQESGDDT